jgi:hypothetical protein
MSAADVAIFFVAFAAILGAYALGQRNGRLSRGPDSELRRADGNVSPVEVLLEYRNATGFTTQRKIKILEFIPRGGGRSCLFAVGKNGTAPRTFRIDRILSIATLDGEVLDTQQFLTERLGIRA